MSGDFRLAQISDSHVRADDDGAAAQRLQRAVRQAERYRADAIVITGDLVNNERADEYRVLADTIRDVATPIYLMPGNHDDYAHLRSAFPDHKYLPSEGAISYAIDSYPVRIVAIDQVASGETHGVFTPADADWLDATLAMAPEQPTVVAMHHPPFRTHDLLFDRIGLLGAEGLEAVIARHPQVARIICGHHHRIVVGQCAQAVVIVAPSSDWTYGLALDDGDHIAKRTEEQPGWALHLWAQETGFASHFLQV